MKSRNGKIGTVLVVSILVATALAGGALAAIVAHRSATTTTVKITEKDYHVILSKHSFSAGKFTFVVKNTSMTTHKFAVQGPGLSKSVPGTIAPGKTKKLTVTLKKGTYTLFCSIHRALGMTTTIKVGGGSTGGGGTTTTTGGGSWG
jgi:plastocyanin